MTQVGDNVPRRTSRTPPNPLVLRAKLRPKSVLKPTPMTAGGYPTGIFGGRAKPKEAKEDVSSRLAELIIKMKKKKRALRGNDRGQTLPLDGSDFVEPMTGARQ